MSDTPAEPKTAEQLARECLNKITNPKGRSDEQCIGYITSAILRATEPLEKRVKELEASIREAQRKTHGASGMCCQLREQVLCENTRLKAVISEAGITIGTDGRVEVDIDDGETWVNRAFVDAELTRLKAELENARDTTPPATIKE